MIEFNEFIEIMELVDLPLLWRGFTWCNSLEGDRWSKIDRFLLDSLWLEKFCLKQWGLPRSISDHCPLVLMEDERNWGPRSFRFLNAWTLHPNFMSMVKKSWSETETYGWAGFRLKNKLANLKMTLKKWNVEVFGNVEHQLKSAKEELYEIDLKTEDGTLLDTKIGRRKELRSLVWKLNKRLEWIWQQKSRVKWAQDEDKNTRFFYVMAERRQGKNLIDTVVENGEVIGEPKRVKQVVVGHFRKLYYEVWKSRPKLDGPFITIGDDGVKRELEAQFTMEEVWAAVKDCDGNKAPGPDRFNLYCIQKSWKVMSGEILQFMHELHSNGKLAKGINSSFVTLIPKKDNPVDLVDYRPISLVGSIYKILAKVQSQRLKKVLPRLVSEVQTAFIGGRCILDGVLIANEVIKW